MRRMAKLGRWLLRKTVFSGKANLQSLDDPYTVMQHLLAQTNVTGIIDAGASDGRVARRLVERFPGATCYLFEPNPDYSAALQQLAKDDTRFVPQFVAVADRDAEQTLYVATHRGPTSLHPPTDRAKRVWGDLVETASEQTVTTTTLDTWAQQASPKPIQLIKLDIQAGELAALRGARRLLDEQVNVIYTEVMFNAMYEGGALFGQIDLLLRESGFVLHDLYGPAHDNQGTLTQANAIFVHADRLGL